MIYFNDEHVGSSIWSIRLTLVKVVSVRDMILVSVEVLVLVLTVSVFVVDNYSVDQQVALRA